jgi:NADH dehydrogenase
LLRFIPTWDRKIRLVLDWLVWPITGRDIVNMRVAEEQGIAYALFEPGQMIVQQGEVGRHLYVIRSGEAEVVRNAPDGEVLLNTLGPGDHFGETAVFQNVRRTATVRARTRMRVLVIERDEAVGLSEAVKTFGEAVKRVPKSGPTAEG